MDFEQHRLIGNDSSRWVHAPNAIEHGGILIVNRYGERAKRVNRTGFSDHQIRCRPLSVDVPRYLRRLIRAPPGSGLFRMRFPEGFRTRVHDSKILWPLNGTSPSIPHSMPTLRETVRTSNPVRSLRCQYREHLVRHLVRASHQGLLVREPSAPQTIVES